MQSGAFCPFTRGKLAKCGACSNGMLSATFQHLSQAGGKACKGLCVLCSACLTWAPRGIRAFLTQLFPIPHAAGWAAALVSVALLAAEDKVKAKLALGCCLQIEMKTNR